MRINGAGKNLLSPAFIIAAVSFAVYSNTLGNGFVYDDNSQILRNPWIRDVKHLPGIFYKSVWNFQGTASISNYYRPLMHVINMVGYHLFGLASWGFHLVNILFHAGNSILIFVVTSRLFEGSAARPEGGEERMRGAFSPPLIAALLFATHPVHTEAVAWVGAVTDLSFTFFYLLAFYLHIESGADTKSHARILSVASFAIALLCKEPAATLPFILIAYDFAFRDASSIPPLTTEFYLKRHFPYFAILGIYFIVRSSALGGLAPVRSHGDLSPYQYVINVFPLFARYLEKLLLPVDLNAFYVFHPIRSLLEFKGIVGVIVAVAYAAATVVAYRKSRMTFLGLLLIAVSLLPTLYIPALGEAAFAERYLYLPSAGFVVLLAASLAGFREKMPRQGLAAILLAISLTALYSVQAIRRNPVWRDDLTLFTDTVKKSPDGELPNGMLGIALMGAGRFDEAIDQFRKTLKLNPDSANAHYNLGLTFMKKEELAEAIPEFQKALTITPNDPDARRYLANSYARMGMTEKAIEQYEFAVRLQPGNPFFRNMLGITYGQKGMYGKAVEQFEAAVRLAPSEPAYRKNLDRASGMKNSPGP